VEKKIWLNGLKWSVISTAGLAVLIAALPGITGSLTNAMDAAVYPDWLIESVVADRKDMLRVDAFRSFLFITLTAVALWYWHKNKLKTTTFITILTILILIDLWA